MVENVNLYGWFMLSLYRLKSGLIMKTLSRSFLPEIFINPISRNLILIFVSTLMAAAILVTSLVMFVGQW